MRQNLLSVIIPCRNQGREIGKVFAEIDHHSAKIPFNVEVIYVDSASADDSLTAAKKYRRAGSGVKILKLKKPGKGRAVKSGMAAANGSFKMFMDADNSTRFDQIDKLLPYVGDYDIVIGSRYVREAKEPETNWLSAFKKAVRDVVEVVVFGDARSYTAQVKQGRWRQFVARGGNLAFTVMLGQCFADTRCGFKLFKKEAADLIFPLTTLPGFGFDTEVLVIAKKYGFSVIEVPVDWRDDAANANVSLADTLKSFWEIVKIRRNLMRGLYDKSRLAAIVEGQGETVG